MSLTIDSIINFGTVEGIRSTGIVRSIIQVHVSFIKSEWRKIPRHIIQYLHFASVTRERRYASAEQ
jgi:hypothetical protein